MGEAKRKRDAGIRNSGLNLFEYMENMEKYSGNVPCGSCRACCYHPNVNLILGDKADKLDFEIRENGGLYLKRKPDGSCIHLTDKGCTVYEHRPTACRTFDCRLYSALGIAIHFEEGRVKAPQWTFKTETVKDLLWRYAGDFAVAGCPEGSDADIVMKYFGEHLDELLEKAQTKLLNEYPFLRKTLAK